MPPAAEKPSPDRCRLILGGVPRVVVGRQEHALEPKHALLLAWLAIEGPTARARLGALLFPDADEAGARNNLRQRLFHLKKKLGTDIVIGDGVLQLAADAAVDLDGELLAGVDAGDLDELVDWLMSQRDRRATKRTDWLAAAAEQAEASGELAAALEHAQALVQLQSESEHAHRRLMRLHYLRGDRAAALSAYEECRKALRHRLSTTPSRETEALRMQIEASADAVAVSAPTPGRVPLTVLRPPRLIGRDSEWQMLNETCAAAGAALIVGEAGLGKSRLLNDLAQARGRALRVTARPGDERVPYAVLTKFLRTLIDAVRPQAAIARELARLLPELGDSQPIHDDEQRARFTNAVDGYVALATREVDTILLDDLQFADAASCEALLRIAQASDRAWVVAMRSAELEPTASRLVQTLVDERAATRIDLQALTQAQVLELVVSLEIDIGGVALNDLAQALYRRAGGNPLYTLETIKSMLATGADPMAPAAGSGLPAVRNVGALIGRRIERLSADAVRLARCAAIAGQEFSIALASRVLGARPLDLADAWNELEAAQVFRDGAFAHDLIFEAASASVPAPIARELHREIAGLLSGDVPPATVAEHWRAAGEWSRAGASFMQAAKFANAASRRAEEAGFLDKAAESFSRCADVAAEFDALVKLTSALTWVDAGHRQQAALDRMLAVAHTPEQRLLALTEACFSEANRGNRLRSIDLAREALALAESLGERESAFKNAGTLAIGLVYIGQHEEALAVFESQRAWVEAHGSASNRRDFDGDRSWPLLGLSRLDEAHEALTRAAGIARELGDLADLNAVLALQASVHARRGDVDLAMEACRQAIALHEVLGSAAGAPMLDRSSMAWLLVHVGRYDEALSEYDAAISAFDAAGMLLQVRRLKAMRAIAYVHVGQVARARQSLPEYKNVAEISPIDHLVLGLLERAAGRGDGPQAISHFKSADPSPRMASTLIGLAEVARVYQVESMAPADARAAAAELVVLARRRGQNGVVIAALAQLALAAAACGERGVVRDAATEALTLMDRFQPEAVYRGDVWLAIANALRAIDDGSAAARVETTAAAWIESIARDHVPPAFRESFLERNRANRALRQAAARARSMVR